MALDPMSNVGAAACPAARTPLLGASSCRDGAAGGYDIKGQGDDGTKISAVVEEINAAHPEARAGDDQEQIGRRRFGDPGYIRQLVSRIGWSVNMQAHGEYSADEHAEADDAKCAADDAGDPDLRGSWRLGLIRSKAHPVIGHANSTVLE